MLEKEIISLVISNDEYARKVLPFLKKEYFSDNTCLLIFQHIESFFAKYNKAPTVDILKIEISTVEGISQEQENLAIDFLNKHKSVKFEEWYIDKTEEFCKNKAVYNAILDSIKIFEGKDKNRSKTAIPSMLSDALAVSFDNNIGHDYINDYVERFELYHKKENKIPFDLSMFNAITKNGLSNKTLNVILAGTGSGKSLFMCHYASSVLLQNKNVLYITLEMSEEKIAERIDANLLNIPIDQIPLLDKSKFEEKVQGLIRKTQGRLIVKEYPTAAAHAGHFRALLEELKVKKQFVPDVLIIDYLNICASSRLKQGANVNSYTYVKSIAEELRGLAVEYDVPLLSATQTTRGGYSNSDIELTDTSESFGLPATCDMLFALINTEELQQQSQLMVKQLKNRYSDLNINKRFLIGIDRSKMRLYDLESEAQDSIIDANIEIEETSEKYSGFKF